MDGFLIFAVGTGLVVVPITIICILASLFSRLGDIKESLDRLADALQARKSDGQAEDAPTQENSADSTAADVPPPLPLVLEKAPQEAEAPQPSAATPEQEPVADIAADIPLAEKAETPSEEMPQQAEAAAAEEPEAKTYRDILENDGQAEEQAVEEPQPPREPTMLQRRLRMLKNWFVYGRAEGVGEGEAAEKLLATTWLLRSGIIVILFTSVFLLKLSIDKGILSPTGRVALSYLAGAALLVFGLSNRMRKLYWSLGQALCGISLGVFYFSSFAMTSMYHLVSAMVGGAVMCITTATAGFLADRLDSMSVALVAMCGGYATPLLLNTGAKNFPGLFAYMLLLGIGVLWLAYRRNWLQLNWLSMLFTYGIYVLAYNRHYSQGDYATCQIALVLFFMLYSTTVFIHNVRRRIPATALEIFGLLANSGLFFGLSWMAIGTVNHGDKLLFAPLTIGLAAYYLLHAVVLGRRADDASRILLLIFCALSGFYLALTFPVVLSGEWLAAAWAMQAFMMLWLGHRMDSRLLKNCAWLLYGVTLVHLAYYEFWLYKDVETADGSFWSKIVARLFQFMLPVASLAAAAKLTMKNAPTEADAAADEKPRLPASTLSGVLFAIAFIVLFLFLRLEIEADLRGPMAAFSYTGVNLVWIGGCLGALMLLRKGVPGWWRVFFCVLMGGTFLQTLVDFSNYGLWGWAMPQFQWPRCFGCLSSTAVLAVGIMLCGRILSDEGRERWMNLVCRITWPILLFIHSTRELAMIIKHKLPGMSGGGISVLWAVFAFVMVYRGISKSIRVLRYLGLALFTIVVFKVFLFDMSHLDAIYKVIAFFIFGVLLLGAAFVYLKFWRNSNWNAKEEK